jgi:DnaK suppressor protein
MAAKAKVKNPWQTYEDALRLKQQELIDSYERDKAAGNAQPDDGIQDLADKAASAYSKELNFSLSDSERNLLKLVEEALDRVRGENFGSCTNCSNTIGEKRLLAIPWTAYCIDCQELVEKGKIQNAKLEAQPILHFAFCILH